MANKPMTEAHKRGNKKWDKENLDRIQLVIKSGGKDLIKSAAEAAGESLNHYMLRATVDRMIKEGQPAPRIGDQVSDTQ